MMMKIMMLLVFAAVCVSAAPAAVTDIQMLMSAYDALNNTLKNLPEEEFFLNDLKVKGHRACTNEFFCQTETELRLFISGLSGAKFEPFRTDKELIRNLNAFNSRHHKKTCPPADSDKIPLCDFLEDLRKCLQMKIRNTK
ncbi:interleukin 4/13A [Triplophysa rosa]|uniref:Interleukin 4/13A n=1 Tax=Triplophysa rosa TaxID=992332 RepID=A0A9W7WCD5_TRIRA|nr:interleukin 4/13A [Triplophysa rosa]